MKSKYLPLITVAIVLCFSACKKENSNRPSQIVGKWYENKLEIHLSNGTAVDHDTTYSSASFTKDDYFLFTSDKKAVLSQSGVYDITGKSTAISGGSVVVGLSHFTWSVADATLKLNDTDRNPATEYIGGPTDQLETIVQLDASHLVLRTTYYPGYPSNMITTTYFTKGK